MEIREVEKNGGFLTLEINGDIREFFVISENKEYSSFSSSLIKAGDCVACTQILAEVVDKKYDSYGLNLIISPAKYEYYYGWCDLKFYVGLEELA